MRTANSRPTPEGRPPRRRRLLAKAVAVVGAAAVLGTTAMVGSAGAIVNGKNSTERYPFMATVPQNAAGIDAQCGATLIDPQWVLTAGHCVDPDLPIILEGKVRIGSPTRTTGGTVRNIDKIVPHPAYKLAGDDGGPNRNDLALIRLDRPVSQKPVKIAKKAGPAGTRTRILGYGTTVDGPLENAKFPNRLQQLNTRLGTEAECSGRVDQTRLCTVSLKPGAMACFGDSGGPQLQKAKNGRWELVGATSGDGDWDPKCATGPGLYSNVTAYTDWIQKTIRTNR